MEMDEIPEASADENGDKAKVEVMLEEDIQLGGHEESTSSKELSEFQTMDGRESPALSMRGEFSFFSFSCKL